jgi:putative phosphoribosyl transferase
MSRFSPRTTKEDNKEHMVHTDNAATARSYSEQIPSGEIMLDGELSIPGNATGVVLFAHGSGSSRHSPRNQFVARTIRQAGVGTLLFDLLTQQEEAVDISTRHLRFDIGLLAERLVDATNWIKTKPDTSHLRVGYFGSSTGGGAALVAAAKVGEDIGAVVSRGGRPDLAGDALADVKSPTLLIVGGLDHPVIRMNEDAYHQLQCEKELRIIPGATHLFEEPGTLEQVARLAANWFREHLIARETE